MPIPIDRIQVVENEIEREHETKAKKEELSDREDNDDDDHIRHPPAMTPPNQDFSFLNNHPRPKRSVHYDIEQLNELEIQPLRRPIEHEPQLDNVLRRRYIAHWGLPGIRKGQSLLFSFLVAFL